MAERTLTREAVRELDRRTIRDFGVPGIVLMESAGRECANEAQRLFGIRPKGPIVCIAGPGNNGGDGFVVARTLVNRGVAARVVFAGKLVELERSDTDAAWAARAWARCGGQTESLGGGLARADLESLGEALARSGGVIDALFGTGLARELSGVYAEWVARVNDAGRPVLAVDIPSGLDADSGDVLGAAVRAHRTVTFVAPKPGLLTGAGPEHCGQVVVAEIGIPRPLIEAALRGDA